MRNKSECDPNAIRLQIFDTYMHSHFFSLDTRGMNSKWMYFLLCLWRLLVLCSCVCFWIMNISSSVVLLLPLVNKWWLDWWFFFFFSSFSTSHNNAAVRNSHNMGKSAIQNGGCNNKLNEKKCSVWISYFSNLPMLLCLYTYFPIWIVHSLHLHLCDIKQRKYTNIYIGVIHIYFE